MKAYVLIVSLILFGCNSEKTEINNANSAEIMVFALENIDNSYYGDLLPFGPNIFISMPSQIEPEEFATIGYWTYTINDNGDMQLDATMYDWITGDYVAEIDTTLPLVAEGTWEADVYALSGLHTLTISTEQMHGVKEASIENLADFWETQPLANTYGNDDIYINPSQQVGRTASGCQVVMDSTSGYQTDRHFYTAPFRLQSCLKAGSYLGVFYITLDNRVVGVIANGERGFMINATQQNEGD